jgi:flagellar basal-body rod protein FlgB
MPRTTGLFDETVALLQKAMNLRSAQHRVLSANIANADTPGYQAFEVVVEEALRRPPGAAPGIRLAATHPAHLPPGAAGTDRVTLRRAPAPDFSLRADGNTVDLDRSMSSLAENAIHYKTAAQLISAKLKSLRNVIQGGRS